MSEKTKGLITGLVVGAVTAILVLWLIVANVSPVRGAYGDITPTHGDNIVALLLLLAGYIAVTIGMRMGKERPEDLIAVCPPCHRDLDARSGFGKGRKEARRVSR